MPPTPPTHSPSFRSFFLPSQTHPPLNQELLPAPLQTISLTAIENAKASTLHVAQTGMHDLLWHIKLANRSWFNLFLDHSINSWREKEKKRKKSTATQAKQKRYFPPLEASSRHSRQLIMPAWPDHCPGGDSQQSEYLAIAENDISLCTDEAVRYRAPRTI